MKTAIVILFSLVSGTASAQMFWPFVPHQERPRQPDTCTERPALDSPILAISVDAMPLPTVKSCFMVDPGTNVPQPVARERARLLRRI